MIQAGIYFQLKVSRTQDYGVCNSYEKIFSKQYEIHTKGDLGVFVNSMLMKLNLVNAECIQSNSKFSLKFLLVRQLLSHMNMKYYRTPFLLSNMDVLHICKHMLVVVIIIVATSCANRCHVSDNTNKKLLLFFGHSSCACSNILYN